MLRRQPNEILLRRNGKMLARRDSRRQRASRRDGRVWRGTDRWPGKDATGTVISPEVRSKRMTSSASVQPRRRQSSTARHTSRRSLACSRLAVQRPSAFQYNAVPVLRIRTCITGGANPDLSRQGARHRQRIQSSSFPRNPAGAMAQVDFCFDTARKCHCIGLF